MQGQSGLSSARLACFIIAFLIRGFYDILTEELTDGEGKRNP